MSSYPTAKKDFKAPVDNEDDIKASDIVTLQQENRAIQDFLGTVSKVQNVGLLDMLLKFRQAVAISVATSSDTVTVPAQRMMIDQRAVVNTSNISLDLDGNIDGSGSSAVSTTYYVYAVDDNVPAGTFSMKFRTSNADNFTGERKIGSVTTASSGSPPNVEGITDDDATAAVDEKLVKAWINFDGSGTISISDSFNVSSIVDNGTGDYTINWDTDFAGANYVPSFMCEEVSTAAINVSVLASTAMAAGVLRIGVTTANDNLSRDPAIVCVMAIGDQ
jgi:hypothetical protein